MADEKSDQESINDAIEKSKEALREALEKNKGK